MDFGFSKQRWSSTQKNYETWWQKKSDRPLINGWHMNHAAHENHKGASNHVSQATMYKTGIPVDYILDGFEYSLLCNQYFGDAYPIVAMDPGPGSLAAYMGCTPADNNGGAWFMPPQNGIKAVAVPDLNLSLDENNMYYTMIQDIMTAAVEKFAGTAIVPMPDLGGNLDVLSSFFEPVNLLYALYDHSSDVQRLLWQVHDAWHKCFNHFNSILTKPGLGCTNWSRILSQKPYYIIQSDFTYMVSPEMFEEFALLELVETTKKIDRTIFHLDGPGMLPHLDHLLEIPDLDGIQWVPGAGNPPPDEWPDILKKIIDADKLLFLNCSTSGLEMVHKTIGNLEKMYVSLSDEITDDNMDEILRRLDKMGIGF